MYKKHALIFRSLIPKTCFAFHQREPYLYLLFTQTDGNMIISMSDLNGIVRHFRPEKNKSALKVFNRWTFGIFNHVCHWGISPGMPETERKKLVIFNRLNIIQLFIGLMILFSCLLGRQSFTAATYISLVMPLAISVFVLVLNRRGENEAALFFYFLLYPIATSVIYLQSIDFGLELYFILFGILSIFFIRDTAKMIFSIALSMTSYIVLAILWQDYAVRLEYLNPAIFYSIQALAILLIFYALFLIREEQHRFQFRILAKNTVLQSKNEQIQKQNLEIQTKAAELEEINAVKNKLFSVISHDMRAPIYALKNVFSHISQYDLPAKEIKTMLPDMLNDVNYVTDLMENLLQWAKSQMGGHKAVPAVFDVSELITRIMGQLRGQAQAKHIVVEDQVEAGIYAHADREMISIVIRNLVSNAVKFTPMNGRIVISAKEARQGIEISVRDEGVGISRDALRKIKASTFYSSRGTNSESGTGLGLMLCREFVVRNGGRLQIKSSLGKGSEFSFTLPRVSAVEEAV
jgi:signal transduction histidine kinase